MEPKKAVSKTRGRFLLSTPKLSHLCDGSQKLVWPFVMADAEFGHLADALLYGPHPVGKKRRIGWHWRPLQRSRVIE
jgi:hypothetical protein